MRTFAKPSVHKNCNRKGVTNDGYNCCHSKTHTPEPVPAVEVHDEWGDNTSTQGCNKQNTNLKEEKKRKKKTSRFYLSPNETRWASRRHEASSQKLLGVYCLLKENFPFSLMAQKVHKEPNTAMFDLTFGSCAATYFEIFSVVSRSTQALTHT